VTGESRKVAVDSDSRNDDIPQDFWAEFYRLARLVRARLETQETHDSPERAYATLIPGPSKRIDEHFVRRELADQCALPPDTGTVDPRNNNHDGADREGYRERRPIRSPPRERLQQVRCEQADKDPRAKRCQLLAQPWLLQEDELDVSRSLGGSINHPEVSSVG